MSKYSEWAVFARLAATIYVLVIVWHHVHWSVALALTVMAVSNELTWVAIDEVPGRLADLRREVFATIRRSGAH